MKVGKTYVLCILMLVLFVTGSCVQNLDVPSAPVNPPVVVKCVLTKGWRQTVTLCYADGLGGGDLARVKEAEVTIGEKGAMPKYGEKMKDGEWEVNLSPDFGKTYELTVRIDGYQEIKSSTRFPDDVTFLYQWTRVNSWDKYESYICSVDRVQAEDGWYYDWYEKDLHLWMRHSDWIPVTTDHRNAEYINDRLVRMFHLAGYGSFKFETGIDINDYFQGRKHSLMIYSVSEELDKYMAEAFKTGRSTDIVSQMFSSATNLYTNVQNGMGVFGAADCASLRFPLKPLEDFMDVRPPYEFERIVADL